MSKPRNHNFTVLNALQLDAKAETIDSVVVYPMLATNNGDVMLAYGTTVPTDGGSGYAKGCLFIDTDVATGTTGLNCNKGTNSSCAFTAVTQA